MTLLQRLLLSLSACLLLAATAAAQTPSVNAFNGPAFTSLAERAEVIVEQAIAPDTDLAGLRQQLSAARTLVLAEQGTGQERVDTLQTQVTALGPEPAEGLLEIADTARRRSELNTLLADASSRQGFANETFARLNRIITDLDRVTHQRQSKVLLSLGPSPFLPTVWTAAQQSLARFNRELRSELSSAWQNEGKRDQRRDNFPAIIALLLVGVLLIFPVRRWLVDLWDHGFSQLRRRYLGVSRFLVSLLVFLSPMVGLFATTRAIDMAALIDNKGGLAIQTVLLAGVCIFGGLWLSRSILPVNPENRPLQSMADWNGRTGRFVIVSLGVVMAGRLIVGQLAEGQQASEPALMGLLFPFTLLGGLGLLRIGYRVRMTDFGISAQGETKTLTNRISNWLAMACLASGGIGPVVALVGYGRLGSLIVFSSLLSLALLTTLLVAFYLLSQLGEGILRGFSDPEAQDAQSGADVDGSPDFLLRFAIAFALFCIGVPTLALIWGQTTTDISEIWVALREGIQVGGTRISISEIFAFVLIFALGYTLTRLIQGFLRSVILPNTKLDKGAQNALVTGSGYVGIFFAALAAIVSTGLDLSNLTIVAGALSIGVGFGLQTIVSNFVSGIILLIERPIKEGDWIEVGSYSGFVKDISVRSTTIDTFDQATVVVPNADLIAGSVTNWTHQSNKGRIIVPIGVSYDSDPEQIREILLDIADRNANILSNPEPQVMFMGFGADSMDFELRGILTSVLLGVSTRSDINFEIVRLFRQHNIEIPFAQRDITIKNAKDFFPDTPKGNTQND